MVSIAPQFLLKSWFLAPISLTGWFLLRNKSKNDNTVKSQILAHPRPQIYWKRGKMYININIFPTALHYVADLSSFISYSSISLTTLCPWVFCYSQSLVSRTLQALFCSFPLSFSPFLLLYFLPPSPNPTFLSLSLSLFSVLWLLLWHFFFLFFTYSFFESQDQPALWNFSFTHVC